MGESNLALLNRLQAAFRDRNIPYNRNELEAALQDPTNAQWVADNLGPDNLLSKEEAELYESLQSSGSLDNVLRTPGLSSTRPLLEDETVAAIDALKASTTAIEAQTETLKSQCKELASILDSENEATSRKEKVLRGTRERNVKETREIDAEIAELKHDFETKTEKARVMLEKENNTLRPSVSNILKEHDQKLQGFEELSASLQDTAKEDMLGDRATKLSTQLSSFLSQEVRCRLDRLYLEGLQDSSTVSSSSDEEEPLDEDEQLASLEEEITSLYSEVDVLAEMSAKQGFQDPISRILQQRREVFDSTSAKQLDNILSTMTYLTTSTENLSKGIKKRQAHRFALHELTMAEKQEMRKEASSTPTDSKQQSRSSPSTANTDQTGKSTAHENKLPSTESVLRRANISLPALLQSAPGSADVVLDQKKQVMLQTLGDSYRSSSASLLPSLAAADKATQLLASALHGDDDSGAAAPANRTHAQELDSLETHLNQVRRAAEGLDFEILAGNPEQERFVERWGT